MKRIIDACGDSLCIVDEAYMDFFGHSIIDYAVTKENVIVLRTCSKAIGLASARLGFAISNAKLIELINRIPFALQCERIWTGGRQSGFQRSGLYKNDYTENCE